MKTPQLCRHLLASVLALTLLSAAPAAFAETHALIPGATVKTGSSVAVDSVWHFVYTINNSSQASDQVQVTWVGNNQWNTAVFSATGQPVLATGTTQLLYVDSNYHFIYYIGADNRLWCWYWSGTAWTNTRLIPGQAATDLVGVDSSFHFVWYRNNGQLWVAYYNGSAWVTVQGPITDYDGVRGAAVDQTSHALYWHDRGGFGAIGNTLRTLYWNGRAYLPSVLTLNTDSRALPCRPAVHQGTGEVFGTRNSDLGLYKHYTNATFGTSQVNVGSVGSGDTDQGVADLAVNPLNGRVIFNGPNLSPMTILTPSGTGGSTTWTRANVAGTNGAQPGCCAMDNGNGWYFYTDANDTFLHISY